MILIIGIQRILSIREGMRMGWRNAVLMRAISEMLWSLITADTDPYEDEILGDDEEEPEEEV